MVPLNRRGLAISLLTLTALAAPVATPAAAQTPQKVAVEFAAGGLFFPDDGVVTEGFLGGAGRFHVRPRVSIGPEIAFVSGEHHSHFMLTGNVTFDFLGPVNGQPRTVTPFAVIGGGIFQTREEFPTGSFTSADPAFTAGAGVRVRLGRSGFAGVETRIGWELHIRLNGLVGVSF
jgi:hypothetical protein